MKNKRLGGLQNDPIPKPTTKKKFCGFCKAGYSYMDYKNPGFLIIFLNPQGKILPPSYTGTCRKHQKRVATAVKRARQLAYLPYLADNLK